MLRSPSDCNHGGFLSVPLRLCGEMKNALVANPSSIIMLADFLARSGYQMGKTPLLPILRRLRWALPALSSALSYRSPLSPDLVLKPFFGILSDRGGQTDVAADRRLLSSPSCLLLYGFITTTEQLLLIRLVHGLATAIYGPVTLAYIAELSHAWIGVAQILTRRSPKTSAGSKWRAAGVTSLVRRWRAGC